MGQFLSSMPHAGSLLVAAGAAAFLTQSLRGGPILPEIAPYESNSGGADSIDFLMLPTQATQSSRALVEISLSEALQAHREGQLFVDARDPGEFDTGHIRGAVLCPAGDVSHWRLHLAGILQDRPIVVYCAEASCGKGEYVSRFLISSGFTNIHLYRDGWVKWTGAKEGK
jgi:rhodanese-related sulfurtransferase